jgi:hypothetical protein
LKLMCLRAGLWKNPQHSVSRFLNHLNLLYKYYGSDALQSPILPLSCLTTATGVSSTPPSSTEAIGNTDRDRNHNRNHNCNHNCNHNTSNHNNNKKRRKVTTRTNKNCNELSPEMVSLKSGEFQLLPSRDRSGRRVVIFQEPSQFQQQASSSSKIITQQQRQHARVSYIHTQANLSLSLCLSISLYFSTTYPTTLFSNHQILLSIVVLLFLLILLSYRIRSSRRCYTSSLPSLEMILTPNVMD